MWERQNMKSEVAINLLNFIIRTVFAVEPSQVSFLFFLFFLRAGGQPSPTSASYEHPQPHTKPPSLCVSRVCHTQGVDTTVCPTSAVEHSRKE